MSERDSTEKDDTTGEVNNTIDREKMRKGVLRQTILKGDWGVKLGENELTASCSLSTDRLCGMPKILLVCLGKYREFMVK